MVAELTRMQRLAGARSVVVGPAGGERWLEERLGESGVELRYASMVDVPPVRCVRGLIQLIREIGVDLLHSHEFNAGVYGAIVAQRLRVPHVCTMHGSRYYAERLRRRMLLAAAAWTGTRFVAVSATLADHLRRDLRISHGRVTVVANGVAIANAQPSPIRAQLGLAENARVLLAVGNLYAVKGHDFLIRALATILREYPDVHVAIAGRGIEETALRTRAQTLGIDNHVHLLGLRDDVPGLLRAADIFVLPSISEGLPLALLEAMGAGVPVVASGVGEIPVVLQDDTGILVHPGSTEDVANAVLRLLSRPDEAAEMARRARERVERSYSLEHMHERYVEVYA
jgi:glycosyltransferase involved in cell wall biosynthesis